MALPRGRDSAYLLARVVTLFLLFITASATTFTVGDTKGWDLGVNYSSWAHGKTFKVGDVLYFPYDQGSHSVGEVTQSGYDSCSTASPISSILSTGNTRITLAKTGSHYFICGVAGHCEQGMKFSIDVIAASTPSSSLSPKSPRTVSSPQGSPNAAPDLQRGAAVALGSLILGYTTVFII